MFTRCYKAV